MVMEALSSYQPGTSRHLPRLRDAWETRRNAEMYPPPDGGYGQGGAGGPSPSRDRYSGSGYGSESRYEPYPRTSGGRSDTYNGSPGLHRSGMDAPSQNPVVVVPGSVSVPGVPGGMPTVLIQQPDGRLVQVNTALC
jgi:hypothetical protein